MALEVVAVLLSCVALGAVVVMTLVAIAGLMDPSTPTRCEGCARWTIARFAESEVLCFRCRHIRASWHPLLDVTHLSRN